MMLVFVLVSLCVSVLSQVATPPRKIGFRYFRGHPSAKIHLEVYLDLLCPDSSQAWPQVKEVASYYEPEDVTLTVHLFPLPYHQNSFYATRAAFVIHYLTNGNKTFDWMDKIMLDKLPELRDQSFHNQSDADLLTLFAQYVEDMGINSSAFMELVDRRTSNQFEMYARRMWKYACVRGVAEAPTFIVNGVIQPNIGADWVLANWTAFLDPLLEDQLFDAIDNLVDYPHHTVTSKPCNEKGSGSSATRTVLHQFTVVLIVACIGLL